MPEVVTCNGDLVLVETCAFLHRLMNTTLFRLRVVVYRENDTHELDRIYEQVLDIRSNSTQFCGNLSREPRQWSVKQGDRVGVQIRDTCVTPNGSDPACPAQANLIDATCASALYLPPLSTPRRFSDFTTVGVNLNVRMSIGECTLTHAAWNLCVNHTQQFTLLHNYSMHLKCIMVCSNDYSLGCVLPTTVKKRQSMYIQSINA